jgi:hypothetical protein
LKVAILIMAGHLDMTRRSGTMDNAVNYVGDREWLPGDDKIAAG